MSHAIVLLYCRSMTSVCVSCNKPTNHGCISQLYVFNLFFTRQTFWFKIIYFLISHGLYPSWQGFSSNMDSECTFTMLYIFSIHSSHDLYLNRWSTTCKFALYNYVSSNTLDPEFVSLNCFRFTEGKWLYPPQTLFVVGILFSRCPCVRACVRPSVTFCFFNILKSHCWIFIKPCKHVIICKTNTLDKKVRVRSQLYWSYFPL